jgi:hypothetical protein
MGDLRSAEAEEQRGSILGSIPKKPMPARAWPIRELSRKRSDGGSFTDTYGSRLLTSLRETARECRLTGLQSDFTVNCTKAFHG